MPNLEKERLSLWSIGETPGYGKRPCDGGILAKYSAGKHIDEPGKQARKGGVVHSE
ncbi:MAG: hypothetical protein RXP28_01385 [Nitrososphaeria archaeon]